VRCPRCIREVLGLWHQRDAARLAARREFAKTFAQAQLCVPGPNDDASGDSFVALLDTRTDFRGQRQAHAASINRPRAQPFPYLVMAPWHLRGPELYSLGTSVLFKTQPTNFVSGGFSMVEEAEHSTKSRPALYSTSSID
jgi:hypothetical protein